MSNPLQGASGVGHYVVATFASATGEQHMEVLGHHNLVNKALAQAEGEVVGPYAGASADAHPNPFRGVKAEANAGVCKAKGNIRANGIGGYEIEAKGPNANEKAEANINGASAMANAELYSVKHKFGPVGVKVGYGLKTGVSFGRKKEVKLAGTGISLSDDSVGFSLHGNEINVDLPKLQFF